MPFNLHHELLFLKLVLNRVIGNGSLKIGNLIIDLNFFLVEHLFFSFLPFQIWWIHWALCCFRSDIWKLSSMAKAISWSSSFTSLLKLWAWVFLAELNAFLNQFMNITRPVYIRQLIHKALLLRIFLDFLAILIEFETTRFNY